MGGKGGSDPPSPLPSFLLQGQHKLLVLKLLSTTAELQQPKGPQERSSIPNRSWQFLHVFAEPEGNT